MKTSNLMQAGFFAAAMAVSGAGVATAQSAQSAPDTGPVAKDTQPVKAEYRHGGPRRGHGHHGGAGRRGGGEMFRTIFRAVDADGDGAVTQDEIDAFRAAKLAEADTSGDGALSIDEFDTLYREFTRSRMVDAFQHLDADGDGVIGAEEMDDRFGSIVERMDRDGDGSLTLQRRGSRRD